MQPVRITAPGGIIPRLSSRRLPEGGAQVAANVSVLPGEWRPLRKPAFLWSPTVTADPLQSVYRLDDSTWFGWTTANVRVERAPLEGEARYIISGDGVPKAITKALATPASASGEPAAARSLGIPTPAVAPSVGHSGGVGAAVSRYYVYTFVSDWNEEGSPSPVSGFVTGKVDGTWAITGMDDEPANAGTVTAATHASGTVTVTTGQNHYLREHDEVTIASVAGMTDLNGVWTVTGVPAANQFQVALTTAQTYTSGGTWTRPVEWGPCTKRIYRTSGSTADFQLVAEGVTGTSYNDTLLDTAIPGDSIVTDGWVPPPGNLTGIVAMPGGMLVGFVDGGRTLAWCEPYQPHAWPEAYKRTLQDEVVGIAPFDTNLAVATTGMPMVFSGVDPSAMSQVKHAKPFPCKSRASVCSIADGVVFATKNGLARMDLGGVVVFTEALFMPEQWHQLEPHNMICAFDGTRLFISTPVENRIYTLDLINGGAMVTAYQRLNCTQADPQTGDLYFTVGSKVYRFDDYDSAPMTMDWFSREYVLPKPFNIGAARVEHDAQYKAQAVAAIAAEAAAIIAANTAIMSSALGGRGSINSRYINAIEVNGSILEPLPDPNPSIAFTLYIDGKIVYSKTIPNDKAFRLPSGYRSDRFAVRLQANTQVAAVVLADTPAALAGA